MVSRIQTSGHIESHAICNGQFLQGSIKKILMFDASLEDLEYFKNIYEMTNKEQLMHAIYHLSLVEKNSPQSIGEALKCCLGPELDLQKLNWAVREASILDLANKNFQARKKFSSYKNNDLASRIKLFIKRFSGLIIIVNVILAVIAGLTIFKKFNK